MKLLFDQHLASILVPRLADLFPDSAQVKNLGMATADDRLIWDYARQNGFTIVSKDSDFQQLSLLYGAPPKVVWLKVGNCPTSLIEKLIRDNSVTLHTFEVDPVQSLLILS
jgi:predicted nuclease of predicted toxin-antitoxin system